MKKNLLFILGMLIALPGFARTFTYTYEGQTLKYEVLDEESKTCQTQLGDILPPLNPEDSTEPIRYRPGNKVSGDLILPSHPEDENGEKYTLTKIGYLGFCCNENLSSVSIPETVKNIEDDAFRGCSRLWKVTLSDGVETIDYSAFAECTNLLEITLPKSLKYIRSGVFMDCSRLQEIILPDALESISSYAFYGCSNLTTVTLPQSLTYLGGGAWAYCDAIKTINCYMTEPITAKRDLFSEDVYNSATLYVPAGSVEAYKNTEPWSYFYNIKTLAESGVENIPNIEDVAIDFTLPYEVFNLNGVKVAESTVILPVGIYIIRQGNAVKKIAVK